MKATTITVTCPTCGALPGKPCMTAPKYDRQGKNMLHRSIPMVRNHGDRRVCGCKTPTAKDGRCLYCGRSTEGM